MLAVLLLVVTGAAAARASGSAAPPAERISAASSLEQELLVAINGVRRAQHLRPLRSSPLLVEAARNHSRAMAEQDFFDHSSADGSSYSQRIRLVYPPLKDRFWGAAENIAWASPGLSARAAVEMWLRSAPHRRNLLAPTWREIGIGGVHALHAPGVFDGLDVTIVTVDFGVR